MDFITLGCSKNLVDTEKLMRRFEEAGYSCVHDPETPEGEVAVVNTCGFIEAAKQESINTILELAQAKDDGRIGKLMVMGCLSQRYRDELAAEIPQVDNFYGKFDYGKLIEDLGPARNDWTVHKCGQGRTLTTPPHYAYLKIAEGCDMGCAYCAIPMMTGRYKSRPMEEILQEARELAARGVRELQVIAQDITYYGVDTCGCRTIAELVDRLADIEGIRWIRLHYAYPNQFPEDLLDVMARRPNVCKYLDIALQHISDKMLSRMRRQTTKAETLALIEKIRSRVPGIAIRTTLMVGFPGETDEDFEELVQFVYQTDFDRMGAFAYSEEEGTYSQLHYEDDVPPEVKEARLNRLMALQQSVCIGLGEDLIGTRVEVVVDRVEGPYYVCRSQYSSPEVDPEILVELECGEMEIGSFYDVVITGVEDYDLYARPAEYTD